MSQCTTWPGKHRGNYRGTTASARIMKYSRSRSFKWKLSAGAGTQPRDLSQSWQVSVCFQLPKPRRTAGSHPTRVCACFSAAHKHQEVACRKRPLLYRVVRPDLLSWEEGNCCFCCEVNGNFSVLWRARHKVICTRMAVLMVLPWLG